MAKNIFIGKSKRHTLFEEVLLRRVTFLSLYITFGPFFVKMTENGGKYELFVEKLKKSDDESY